MTQIKRIDSEPQAVPIGLAGKQIQEYPEQSYRHHNDCLDHYHYEQDYVNDSPQTH